MKLSRSSVFSSLLCAASALDHGYMFTYDPIANSSPAPDSNYVTPETARLILAQRLGLSRFHSIKNAKDEAIVELNAYGGRAQKLFSGEDRQRTNAHVLIWVEGVAPGIAQDWDNVQKVAIANPPCASSNDRLIQDLILQATSLPAKPDPHQATYNVGIETEELLKPIRETEIHNGYLSVLRVSKADKVDLTTLSNSLKDLLMASFKRGEAGFPITVVMMPSSSGKSKCAEHPYGTYDMPSILVPRGEPTEAPMSLSNVASTTPNIPSNLEDFPVIMQINDTTPVLGILPACFSSQALCISSTKNCSSHGSCGILHKGTEGKDGVRACWGCACIPTVKIVSEKGMEEKRQVTYWGGPACQKMDISVPFFLFLTIGVLLAGLISAAIGMMFNMGNQELPSVIGAGVSGPVRK
ncbi:hypothetical protein K504DRAFT_460434 [Pleomassaria siparia CBS 279.74]|uniref:Uncharacterized protein n=1 Tax=Pleomassaria siparia CBS 279.74 TaxID=1314801 RepID=A0A6G1JX31_9PLEO|nr:hypothetical protein K504DRAFT_460434 [Pleomassaria siparia CBS 279.74]